MAETATLENVSVHHETLTGADGYPMHVARYSAVGRRRGAVACVHGIQSHAGWYERSCTRMAHAGFEVFFLDRRGSGRNTQDRGHARGQRQLVDDLTTYVEYVKGKVPDAPTTLLAISWGAKLALAALRRDPRLADALVFVAPGWFAKVDPTPREKLAIAWSFFFRPRRLVRIPLSDPALFTANPIWQEFLRTDALSLRWGTARLLMSSRVLDRIIPDVPESIHAPSLLILGGLDRIIDNSRTRNFFDRFAAEQKQVVEYPDAHHTLEFEEDPEPVFDDLVHWLQANASIQIA